VISNLHQLAPAVVGLPYDTFPGLGDVVLEAHDFLKAQLFAELGSDLHAFVIDRVTPVETNERRGAVVSGE